jgi:dimethylhistidine N-methyltransferase
VRTRVAAPPDFAVPSAASITAEDVRAGLARAGQKTLPSKYFYDAVGSALFEAICHLPEYGLTRAGERILVSSADAIVDAVPSPLRVVELGSGTGRKTKHLLAAVTRRQPVVYHPIDISSAALEDCARELGRIPEVRVASVHAEYLDGMASVTRERRAGERLLVLFLGSTIGNFERPAADEFLRDLREAMRPGDALLLATDLVKSVDRMLRAYDDPAGVTAAFNKNLLVRVNRELGADFDLTRFAHEARWNERDRAIEMHLRATERQRVVVRKADLMVSFEEDETIWTESSHKYAPQDPIDMGRRAGFRSAGQWVDEAWPFAQTLLVAA